MANPYINQLCDAINEVMFGMEDVVKLSMVALYTNGHILLEGNPGLGKTDLVRNISYVLGLPFDRIQFTPDLLPSDITGTQRPIAHEGSMQMAFQPGPIFTALLLADEINRATPKTQAAMLEAMAERRVTVLGNTIKLDARNFKNHIEDDNGGKYPIRVIEGRPFFVMATQNPIDHEGTYDLPEAQSDRFMFKILMPTPDESAIKKILDKTTRNEKEYLNINPNPEEEVNRYQQLHQQIKNLTVRDDVEQHIINIYLATNNQLDKNKIDRRVYERLQTLVSLLSFGLGPRAARDMAKATKAYALFYTATGVPDFNSLAQVIVPILRHRIKLRYDWRGLFNGKIPQHIEPAHAVDYFIRDLAVCCVPAGNNDYQKRFNEEMNAILQKKAI